MIRWVWLFFWMMSALLAEGRKDFALVATAGHGQMPGQEDPFRGRNVNNHLGSVDLISGHYNEEQVDIFTKGPEPIIMARIWKDGQADRGNLGGWGFNNYQMAYFKDHQGVVLLHIAEPYGEELLMFNPKNNRSFLPHQSNFAKGFTNASLGEIGGNTTPKSMRAEEEPEKKGALLTVIDPDGTKRIMRHKPELFGYYTDVEERPHKRQVAYSWQPFGQGQFFSSIKAAGRRLDCELPSPTAMRVTSKGRTVGYTLTPSEGGKLLVSEVQGGNSGDFVRYSYSPDGQRLLKREAPNGRSLENLYWDGPAVDFKHATPPGHKTAFKGDRVACQLAPVGADRTAVVTARYFYYELFDKDKKIKGGCTDVVDAVGNTKRYWWDKTKRIRNITTIQGDSVPIAKEDFVWVRSNCMAVGNLSLRAITDQRTGQIVYVKTLSYDGHHNPTVERTHGIITGIEPERAVVPCLYDDGYVGGGEYHTKTMAYSQDDLHLLLEESSSPNHKTTYSYWPGTDLMASRLEWAKGVIGRRHFFQYDESGILTQKIFDDGRTANPDDLTGVSERHITQISIIQGQPECTKEFYLDLSSGRLILVNAVAYTYGENDLKASETVYDANFLPRYTLTYQYDEKDRLIIQTDKYGVEHKFGYDANNNCIFEQHRPDVVMEKRYDWANRLIMTIETHNDGRLFVTRNEWNRLNQLVREYDIFNRPREYEYDIFGNQVLIKEAPYKTAEGSIVRPFIRRQYDLLGNIIEESDADGHTLKKSWTVFNKPLLITYPDGSQEQFFYTLHGALSKKINRDGTWLVYTLDPFDRIVKEEFRGTRGELLSERTFTYNALHLVEESDAAGTVTRYRYDGAGRIIEQLKGGLVKTIFEYDAYGEVRETKTFSTPTLFRAEIVIRNPFGHVVEERLEDGFGQIQKKTTYHYNYYGQRVSVKEYTADDAYSEMYTQYDSRGEISLTINPEGHHTRFSHTIQATDELGQSVLQKQTMDPLGHLLIATFNSQNKVARQERYNVGGQKRSCTEFFYTPGGLRAKVVERVFVGDDEKRTYNVSWSYNAMKQIVLETRNDERCYHSFYDSAGRLIKKNSPNGTMISYAYDQRSRLIKTVATGQGAPVSYEFVYNASSEIIAVNDLVNKITTIRTYDVFGVLQQEILGNGLIMTFENDLSGRKTALILPDGSRIGFDYEGHFLKRICRNGWAQEVVQRNLQGQILRMEGLGTISRDYDIMRRNISIQTAVWSEDSVEFDPMGHLTACRFHSEEGDFPCSYAYDDLYQVAHEQSTVEHHYTNDSLYNRVAIDDQPCRINRFNELLDDGKSRYRWDDNGNLTNKSKGSDRLTYIYDALDRLVAVKKNNQILATYLYDSFNRRLSKTVEGQETLFLYDGQNEIGASQNGHLTELRFLGDALAAEIGASWAFELDGELFLPVHDNRGNVSALQTPQGDLVETYRYSSFGEETTPASPLSPWRFSSKRVDPETSFVYFGRRHLDPTMGRWTTSDPQGFEDGLNVYAFLKNSPMNSVDAYGLWGFESPDKLQNRMERTISSMIHNFAQSFIAQVRKAADAIERAVRQASYGLKKMIHSIGHELEFLGRHTPIPIVNKVIESIGSLIVKRDKYPHASSVIMLNPLRYKDGHPLVLENGMLNSKEAALDRAEKISAYFGNPYTVLVYNGSGGILNDVTECIVNFFGVRTMPVRLLENALTEITKTLAPGDSAQLCVHSQAGLIADLAAKNLPASVRQRVNVNTFGSPRLIQKGVFGDVLNHVSDHDPIPWVDAFARAGQMKNIPIKIYHGRGVEHCLGEGTYDNVLRKMGQGFREDNGY